MALTVNDIINIAKISQYLATLDVEKGSLFGKRIVPDTPQILYNERKAVEWMYALDPANTSLTSTSNYLYSLCRGYNLQAQAILGTNTGGSVSPVTPTSIPSAYDFVVSGSSLIPTGASSVTLTAYIGWNILVVRGGIVQSSINTGGSYYSWNKTTGLLTISPQAYDGEQIQLYPV
jgi:hypothetical protein